MKTKQYCDQKLECKFLKYFQVYLHLECPNWATSLNFWLKNMIQQFICLIKNNLIFFYSSSSAIHFCMLAMFVFKCQLISKVIFGSLNSSKKNFQKQFDLRSMVDWSILFCFFIRCLEELKTQKIPFEINWPSERVNKRIWINPKILSTTTFQSCTLFLFTPVSIWKDTLVT